MADIRLGDGSTIEAAIEGTGPAVLLPVDPVPVEGDRADELRKWGVDPALGRRLVDGLSDRFRVVAFDYEGHLSEHPKPDTLTPATLAADFLAIADAAQADRFAFYGYSWLALAGLQLALRTDRLSALVMGGYPPLDGPYEEMLAVTTAGHDQAIDAAAQCRGPIPRLCFAGSADTIDYGESWGDVRVDLAGPLVRERDTLARLGWHVRVLEGLDHTSAMQPDAVLPILRPWLSENLF